MQIRILLFILFGATFTSYYIFVFVKLFLQYIQNRILPPPRTRKRGSPPYEWCPPRRRQEQEQDNSQRCRRNGHLSKKTNDTQKYKTTAECGRLRGNTSTRKQIR